MQFLCNLIPEEFSGNRYELGQFIASCNNADELASARQKTPLLYFILSKISGNAKEQLALQNFSTWTDLKEQLKILFQDKKHYCQIMEELNNSRQHHSENITACYQRLLTLSSRALSAIQQYSNDPLEIPGKKKSVEETTLNRFVYHSCPQISQMLRWKEFSSLNSAYSAAVAEERVLNMHKYARRESWTICSRTNHGSSQCRLRLPGPDRNRVINNIQISKPNQSSYRNQHQYQYPNEFRQPQMQNRIQHQNPIHSDTNQHASQLMFCNYCKKTRSRNYRMSEKTI